MSDLVEALQTRDTSALDSVLGAEVTFRSPVRTYRDRDEVLHLLSTLAGLFDEARQVRRWGGPQGAATYLAVRIDDLRLDGLLEEVHDEHGRVVELTLMLRPLTAMLEAVERMGRALGADGGSAGSGPSPSPADRASRR